MGVSNVVRIKNSASRQDAMIWLSANYNYFPSLPKNNHSSGEIFYKWRFIRGTDGLVYFSNCKDKGISEKDFFEYEKQATLNRKRDFPTTQDAISNYYIANNKRPCCAGCKFWEFHNAIIGECTNSSPVSGSERIGMLEIESSSFDIPAGFILTKRDYSCGQFDVFD